MAESVVALRKILSSDKNPPIADVLDAGLLPRLRDLLADFSRPLVQHETAWALTNISSGTPEQTQAVVDSGVVPIFVELLKSADQSLQEQAMWAIANIAGDRADYRDGCIAVGTVEALSNILESSLRSKATQMARLAAWGLSNLCRGQPAPDFRKLVPSFRSLGRALSLSNDSEVLGDTAWALSYLTDTANAEYISLILRNFDLNRTVALLGHPSSAVHLPILRVVGNLVSGHSDVTRAVVSAGALKHLKSLAFSHKKTVRKEALWAISNICADSQPLVQEIMDTGLMAQICDIVKNGSSDAEIRKEAVWTLCNAATVGNREQIYSLVLKDNFRIVDTLGEYLETCRDAKSIRTVLDSLFAILKVGEDQDTGNPFCDMIEQCGGLETIEKLQEDASEEVYEGAVRILETFFDCQELGETKTENIRFDFTSGNPILPFTRSG